MGMITQGLVDNIIGGIISGIVVVVLISLFGNNIFRMVRRRYSAGKIRRHAGDFYSVLICDIEGDEKGHIGSLLRANIEANYTDGSDKPHDAVQVVHFPLRLAASGGVKNARTARRWMDEINSDVIVWGERGTGENSVVVKVMGKNFEPTKATEVRLSVDPGEFNDLLASAITREIVNVKTRAFDDPEALDIKTLSQIAKRTALLSTADLPGMSQREKASLYASLNALLMQISRRAPTIKTLDLAMENAERHLLTLNRDGNSIAWANSVVDLCFYTVQRAWLGLPAAQVDAVLEKVVAARDVFKANGLDDKSDLMTIDICWVRHFRTRSRVRDASEKERWDALDDESTITGTANLIYHRTKSAEVRQAALCLLFGTGAPNALELAKLDITVPGWFKRGWQELNCVNLDLARCCSVMHYLEWYLQNNAGNQEILDASRYLKNILDKTPFEDNIRRAYLCGCFLSIFQTSVHFNALLHRSHEDKGVDVNYIFLSYFDFLQATLTQTESAPRFQAAICMDLAKGHSYLGFRNQSHMHYSQANDLFIRAGRANKLSGIFSDISMEVARCVNINDWSQLRRDVSIIDKNINDISDLKNYLEDEADYGNYVLAFAHYLKMRFIAEVSSYHRRVDEAKESAVVARNLLELAARSQKSPIRNAKIRELQQSIEVAETQLAQVKSPN